MFLRVLWSDLILKFGLLLLLLYIPCFYVYYDQATPSARGSNRENRVFCARQKPVEIDCRINRCVDGPQSGWFERRRGFRFGPNAFDFETATFSPKSLSDYVIKQHGPGFDWFRTGRSTLTLFRNAKDNDIYELISGSFPVM